MEAVGKVKALIPAGTKRKIDTYFARGLASTREAAVEDVRRGRVGVARTRFKEGFTTEEQFRDELELLRVPEEEKDIEVVAAELDYATDYLRDLITAYRDGLRKGHYDLAVYRELLLKLGIVPERVEGYVIKERARLKPEEPLVPLAPPAPYYETDAGKLQVDTIRRRRRKNLIPRDQEIAALITLGMDPVLAASHADNDDVRLAEKGGED